MYTIIVPARGYAYVRALACAHLAVRDLDTSGTRAHVWTPSYAILHYSRMQRALSAIGDPISYYRACRVRARGLRPFVARRERGPASPRGPRLSPLSRKCIYSVMITE